MDDASLMIWRLRGEGEETRWGLSFEGGAVEKEV